MKKMGKLKSFDFSLLNNLNNLKKTFSNVHCSKKKIEYLGKNN